MRKTLSLITTIIFSSLLLSGCSNSEFAAYKKAAGIKPTVLTMFSQDPNYNDNGFQSPVAEEIKKRTGIELKIEYPVGDVSQAVNMILVGKEYPDLVFAKGAELEQFIHSGALIDLTPLIDKYGPNIKKLYGKYLNRLRYSIYDKSIYTLSSNAVDEEKWEPTMGFGLQHAVVKELGYPKIETVKDFENAIKKYKQLHPTIDGKETIGLSLFTNDWYWTIGLGNGAGFATGAPDDGNWYINPDTYEAKYRFTRPEEKEYYRWLNHMNDIGLLDPDSFVQRLDAYTAKIASGRVLGLIDAKWVYSSGETMLKSEGKFERTYGMYPVQYDKSTKAPDFRDVGYTGGWGIGISSSCKDPVAAIKFLDWMSSEEGQILRNWGVEGVNYKVVEDKRVIPEEEFNKSNNDKDYKKKTGVGAYVYPFPVWGNGKKDSLGQPFTTRTTNNIIETYSPIEKEVLAAYGEKMWKDLYPQQEELKKSSWGMGYMINIPGESDLAEILKKCDENMKEGLPKVILCKPEQFDQAWDKMMEELVSHGVNIANREFTKLVKEQVELFNKE
jgi:putative aldouronate transport system substrate-binding protein